MYFVDYSFTNPIDVKNVVKLAEKYASTVGYFDQIVWIDHHASSQKLINEDPWLRTIAKAGIVRPENVFAGCMLTWLYFHPPSGDITLAKLRTPDELRYYIHAECPIWIQYVDDHDKWAHKMANFGDILFIPTLQNHFQWIRLPRCIKRGIALLVEDMLMLQDGLHQYVYLTETIVSLQKRFHLKNG